MWVLCGGSQWKRDKEVNGDAIECGREEWEDA